MDIESINDCTDNFILESTLIENEISIEDEDFTVFGISIVKRDKSGKEIDKACVKNITANKIKALNLLKLVKSLRVTPLTLYDIAEDYIS